MVGIDYGTYGTAAAWAPFKQGQPDPGRITLFEQWPGSRIGVDVKTMTALLVKDDREILAWGHSAVQQAPSSRAGRPGSPVRLVHGFKMSLAPRPYPGATSHSEIGLADNEAHPERLITGFLRHVYQTLLAELRAHLPDLEENEIRWCVTVPAMWGDREKQIMRDAAHAAGFPRTEGCLLLALEPDAAAHNAQVSGVQYVGAEHPGRRGSLDGVSRFMVVDCGGGTIDITCYTIDGNGYLVEIDREGIAQGSLYVNRALRDLVLVPKLGGQEEYRRLEQVAPHALEELLRDWEIKKGRVTPDSTDHIWLDLKMSLAKHLSDEVTERLDASQDGDDENIWITADEARSAFDAVIPDILELVDRKLADLTRLTTAADKPDLVLLAGGFAQSRYLRHRLREYLRGRAVVAVTPQPQVDVVEGAVRFAYNPKVRARRSQYTYGTEICAPFEHGTDPLGKLYRSGMGKELCRDRFDVFVNAGDIVPVDKPTVLEFVPVERTDDAMTFTFYRTKEREPRYVDNEGCEEFATCDLTIDLTEAMHLELEKRSVTLHVSFGETELRVRAVLDATGEEYPTTLKFSTR
ncbi:acetate and sugar kinases/Hsc70/actin family protein [Amycolatopsis aidingensis]|uniref:hypothetical protein n=1 Tax=Amycolatopsis aidingensis TaxID=2842453 RepID=UPI001C0C5C71|nr:hypothetical protein [Amycolatopsis aidingensis]